VITDAPAITAHPPSVHPPYAYPPYAYPPNAASALRVPALRVPALRVPALRAIRLPRHPPYAHRPQGLDPAGLYAPLPRVKWFGESFGATFGCSPISLRPDRECRSVRMVLTCAVLRGVTIHQRSVVGTVDV
jgi:hypothetical protein